MSKSLKSVSNSQEDYLDKCLAVFGYILDGNRLTPNDLRALAEFKADDRDRLLKAYAVKLEQNEDKTEIEVW
ncbi:hypothetical protein [Enterococcus olivae]